MPTINVRWSENTNELTKNLARGTTQLEATRASVDKLVKSFQGENLIAAAHKWAVAIDQLGGITKLTATEQARANVIFTKASEKLTLLGKDGTYAGEQFKILAAQTKGAAEAQNLASQSTQAWSSVLRGATSILGAFGVSLSIGAVVRFSQALLADADALVKMSDKTGITIEGLQRMKVVGDDAGNTVEQMSSAINKFQDNLVGGNTSAVAALKTLGIGLEQIKAMGPERQFMAISDALRHIQDPAQQVNLAMDLFGRSGAEILPSLKRGFDDVRDSVVGMSADTVRALDEAGDTLNAFWRDAKGMAAWFAVEFGRNMAAGWNVQQRAFNDGLRAHEAFLQHLDKEKTATALAAQAAFDYAVHLQTSVGPMMDLSTEIAIIEEGLKAKAQAMADDIAATEKAVSAYNRAREAREKWNQAIRADEIQRSFDAWVRETTALNDAAKASEALAAQMLLIARNTQPAGLGVVGFVADLTKLGEIVPVVGSRIDVDFVGPMQRVEDETHKVRNAIRSAFGDIASILDNIRGKWAEFGAVVSRTVSSVMDNLAQGDIVGAVVSGVTGAITAIGRLFGPSEANRVDEMRGKYLKAAGGLEALGEAALESHTSIELVHAVLTARTVEDYERAVEHLNDAIRIGNELNAKRQQLAEAQLSLSRQQIQNANDVIAGFAPIARTARELDNLGVLAVASFNAARAAGLSMVDAIAAAAPGLQQLKEAYDRLGISTDNELFSVLMLQATILKNNPSLLRAVSALGDSFSALAALGRLNEDTFRSMEETGLAMYARLQGEVAAVGGGTADALLPMQDYLHRAEKAAADLGIPLDENTQRLIDQSKELGIWQDAGKSATDKMIDAMNLLVLAIDKMTLALEAIPNITRTVTIRTVHTDEGDDGPGFARGTQGRYLDFGLGTPVILHGRERVMTEAEGRSGLPSWGMDGLSGSRGMASSHTAGESVAPATAFGSGVTVSMGDVNVYATGADLADMTAFAPKFLEALRRNEGGMYSAIETIAERVT